MSKFKDDLQRISALKKSLICVGLDPDPDKMPVSDVYEFCKVIVDQTEEFVTAYKPNLAFFEALGLNGLIALEKLISYVKTNYPNVLLLGDGKRGDIGDTSRRYAYAMFNLWDFDAVTVNAFAGFDSIESFLEYRDRGIFVWCKSSNPDGHQLQDLSINGNNSKKVFQVIAENCVEWNTNDNIGLVVGATYPEELQIVRDIAEDLPILVPGIGPQMGDLEASVKAGLAKKDHGLLISSSRGIIYASNEVNMYGDEARNSSQELSKKISNVLDRVGRNFN